jgi:cobalt-zinc-cadmium efflux system protein
MPHDHSGHAHASHSEKGHDHDHHDHRDHHGHARRSRPCHGHHGHSHAPKDFGRAFAIGTALNLGFVLIEAAAGLMTHSLALLADAGHNLSDVLGLLLAWGAVVLAKRAPSARRTYGLRKGTILASLTNAALLLVAVGAIAWEAVRRFADARADPDRPVMIVAAIGIVINTATALMFMKGSKDDLNVRGAFLHMAADAAVSAGVVVAAVAMALTGWLWLDPVVSLGIVAGHRAGHLGPAARLAGHGPGRRPARDRHRQGPRLAGRSPGVTEVHDLHIWAMSTTETAMTAHVVRP